MTQTELLNAIRQEIKRRYAYQKQMYERKKPDGRPNDGWSESLAIMGELEDLLSSLDTLEEPEGKDDMEFCKTNCKGYRETGGKCFFDGSCDAKKKATQEPEVDLRDVFEKEYAKFSNDTDPDDWNYTFPIDLADYKEFAWQFFELGLNARKEEEPKVDLDGKVTFDCISMQVTMTIQELINYYIDTECCNVAEECGF